MMSTVICSTYNSPNFLELVLNSLLFQDQFNFELLIADDGSNDKTKDLINDFKVHAPFKVTHVWHEDKDWRKSQIHNKSIAIAKNDHLIFIDGDCILGTSFVSDHQLIYKENLSKYVFMGRRVELGEKLTKELNLKNYRKVLFSYFSLRFVQSCISSDTYAGLRKFSFHNPFLRKVLKANNVLDLLGCNFSLSKKSMIEINGFNDEYQRGEDGDIFIRLRNSGHKLIGKKYFAVMFHLFHSRGNYQYVDDNYAKIYKDHAYKWAQDGLNKYLA